MSGELSQPDQQDRRAARAAFEEALADIFGGEGPPAASASAHPTSEAAEPAERTSPLLPRERPVGTDAQSTVTPLRLRHPLRMWLLGCLVLAAIPFACVMVLAIIGLLFPTGSSVEPAPAVSLLTLALSEPMAMDVAARNVTGE